MINYENIATYNLYVGLNDKDTYKQIIDDNTAMEIVRSVVSKIVGGATFTKSFGYWIDEFGNETTESTIVIKVTMTDDETIKKICEILNEKLNQNCIMVEKTLSQIAYV